MKRHDSDALDDFWRRAKQGQVVEQPPAGNETDGLVRSGFLKPKTRVNYLEVQGPVEGPMGRFGRRINNQRNYHCVCVAPTGPGGQPCGHRVIESYHRLYYGNAYSCGCIERHKHPAIHLEGKVFGQLEVLHWDEREGYWECVCLACGTLFGIPKLQTIREEGEKSCDKHLEGE